MYSTLSLSLRPFFLCLFCSLSIAHKSYAAFPIKETAKAQQQIIPAETPVQKQPKVHKSGIFGALSLGIGLTTDVTFLTYILSDAGSPYLLYVFIGLWAIGVVFGIIGLSKKRENRLAALLGVVFSGVALLLLLALILYLFVALGGDFS